MEKLLPLLFGVMGDRRKTSGKWWHSGEKASLPQTLTYTTPEKNVACKISFLPRGDHLAIEDCPKDFQIFGINGDRGKRLLLAEKKGNQCKAGERVEVPLKNSGAFYGYEIYVTATGGNLRDNIVVIRDVQINVY